MSEEVFRLLLDELFRVAGVSRAAASRGVASCQFAGAELALYYDECIDPSNLHAYIDVCEVHPARQREAFRRLLSRNLSLLTVHRAVAGLDETTERIVLMVSVALTDAPSGSVLANRLFDPIKLVEAWCMPKPSVRLSRGNLRTRRRPS